MENVEFDKEKTLETVKVPFECPRCHWIMRSAKPDNKHPIPSVAKPCESNVEGNVLTQSFVCRNPRCKASFTVYWFTPRDYLKRV